MGKLNVARNLFLEREELIRQFEKFSADEGYLRNLDIMTKSYGIIPVNNNDIGDNFKIIPDPSIPNRFILSSSLSYHNAIAVDGYINVPQKEWYYNDAADDTWRYVYVGYDTTNLEEGTISLSSDGTISGLNTSFYEVLRGITTNVPTKIRIFQSDGVTEIGDYQVISVDSATSCSIVGNTTTGTGLRYQVIGSFSPSETDIPDSDRDVYEYDSYDFIIQESDITPTGYFKIAKLKSSVSSYEIIDLRQDIWRVKDNANWGYVDLDDYTEYGYDDDKSAVIIPRWGDNFYCTLPEDAQIDTFYYIRDPDVSFSDNIEGSRRFTIRFDAGDGAFINLADGSITCSLKQWSGNYINDAFVGLGIPIENFNYYKFFKDDGGNFVLESIHNKMISVNNLAEFNISDGRSSYPNFDTLVREGSDGFKFRALGSAKLVTTAFSAEDLDSGIYYGLSSLGTDFPDISDLSDIPTRFLLSVNSQEANTAAGRFPKFYELRIFDVYGEIYLFHGGIWADEFPLYWRKINKGQYTEPTEFKTTDFSPGWSKSSGTLGNSLSYEINGNEVKLEGWISYVTGDTGGEIMNNMAIGGFGNIGSASNVFTYAFGSDGSPILLTLSPTFGGSLYLNSDTLSTAQDYYINVSYRRELSYND